ncbi:MAG TPA: patatin-like phospholipase family protein [Xanthobacteraceae bacterium]|nr:patatin-like phospholipase family protein [Xanthobacteraceae bacterium]
MLDFLIGRGKNEDRAALAQGEDARVARPTIGLALGGGAARGFAHIGVIRALVDRGLNPDVIVGTSMGAVVGGCHAAGQLDVLEAWAQGLTTRDVLSYLDISLTGSGLIDGRKLATHLHDAIGEISIEDLPVRFAAIAAEIGTGHEIWLTRGRLTEALRASYSLPGVFAPVRLGGRWLVDGVIVNPVPVAAARALGARLVIAVNLNADMFGRGTTIADHGSNQEDDDRREEDSRRRGLRGLFGAEQALRRQLLGTSGRPGIATVMMDAFNVMQDRITRSRLAGDPPDVLISPRLGQIGLFEFHRAKEAIALGAEATEKALAPVAEAIAALT